MPSGFAQHLHYQFGRAVDNSRMLHELWRGVYVPRQANATLQPSQIAADGSVELREDCQGTKARGSSSRLDIQFASQSTDVWVLVIVLGDLPRDVQRLADLNPGLITGAGYRGLRKYQA
jgi:hypothetical protein